ncbi:unnamed protein product [Musa hybrid cultivar]
MGGGLLAFFGLRRQQTRGHEKAAEPRQRRKGHEPDRRRPWQAKAGSFEAEMEPWQRKVRRTDEDHGRWVSGLDVDRKAEEFIHRVHRRMNPELLEALER